MVYGCYSAVYDIIEDDMDGFIIPKTSEGFNAAVMAERMEELMSDVRSKREEMALAAIRKSNNYSIDRIYEQWMAVIYKML